MIEKRDSRLTRWHDCITRHFEFGYPHLTLYSMLLKLSQQGSICSFIFSRRTPYDDSVSFWDFICRWI